MANARIIVEIGDLDTHRVAEQLKNKSRMFSAIGVEVMKEIGRNFEMGGIWGKWAPLRPNTIVKRRKKSSKPLQDSGKLKASFRMEASNYQVVIGSPLKIAKYHHEGRKGPWVILPRRARALVFPVVSGGRAVGFKEAFKSYGYKKRSSRFLAKTKMAVVKRVNHPGYPSRPLLPPEVHALRIANEVITTMLMGNR